MRLGILTFLAFFVMCGVSYASDVYITQSGQVLLQTSIKMARLTGMEYQEQLQPIQAITKLWILTRLVTPIQLQYQ